MMQTLEQLSAAATDLLPCPFCGGDGHWSPTYIDRDTPGTVECANGCGATVIASGSKAERIAAWNQRTGQLVAVSDDAIERVARTLAPNLEGGREFDQMPKDRVQLRQWTAQGMCLINDATQDDATWLAGQAIAAMKDTQP